MMKKRFLSVILSAVLIAGVLPVTALAAAGLSNFKKVNTYTDGLFTDVPSGAWYADEVRLAYEYGLINGKSAATYEPDSFLTIAEAVKLAACLHSIYNTGAAALTNGDPWYRPYTDYALSNGIIAAEYKDYGAYATRAEFAFIFVKALPPEGLQAINTIKNNVIPDVDIESPYGPAVYMLYRAGVLTGSGSGHAYLPGDSIKRSEVSAIVARMANTAYRQAFSMTAAELSAEDIKSRCSPAVFYIDVYDASGALTSSASGFFISGSGMAVTNYHVIKDGSTAVVRTTDGRTCSVLGVYDTSEEHDLALLQVSGGGFRALEPGDSTALSAGLTAYAVENPPGQAQTFTSGVISNASYPVSGLNYMLFNAPIAQKCSGGAVINAAGQVIGVTSALIDAGADMNPAIPIHLIGSMSRSDYVPLSTIASNTIYTLTAFPLAVTVAAGSQVLVMITESPGNPEYTVYTSITDTAVVSCNWGAWFDDFSCPLHITGLKAGSAEITVYLIDESDRVITSAIISVTVTGG